MDKGEPPRDTAGAILSPSPFNRQSPNHVQSTLLMNRASRHAREAGARFFDRFYVIN